MTDMVERVARALCDEQWGEGEWGKVTSVWTNNEAMAEYRRMARAALEAAFKVTDEDAEIFFGRGEKSGGEFVNHGWLRDFKTGMQALSDAALKEGP